MNSDKSRRLAGVRLAALALGLAAMITACGPSESSSRPSDVRIDSLPSQWRGSGSVVYYHFEIRPESAGSVVWGFYGKDRNYRYAVPRLFVGGQVSVSAINEQNLALWRTLQAQRTGLAYRTAVHAVETEVKNLKAMHARSRSARDKQSLAAQIRDVEASLANKDACQAYEGQLIDAIKRNVYLTVQKAMNQHEDFELAPSNLIELSQPIEAPSAETCRAFWLDTYKSYWDSFSLESAYTYEEFAITYLLSVLNRSDDLF